MHTHTLSLILTFIQLFASHTHTNTHTPTPPTASVRVCPVPGRGVALQGVHVAVGGAAWRGGGVDLGMGEGRVPDGSGSLVGTAGRQGSHPAEKTSPGDLMGRHKGKLYF